MSKLVPSYYRVSIEASGLTGLSADSGFVDNKYLHEYFYSSAFPSSLDNAKNKARANARYEFLISELSENQSISLILDENNGGATVDSPGSSFSFTVVYDRDDFVYTKNELFGVSGHPTEFDEYLYGEDAVKRQCARLWVHNRKTQRRMYLNLSAYGWVDEDLDVKTPLNGSLVYKIDFAEARTTVTKIPHTY